jgi:small conductance mechanosensitive channel
VLNILLVVAILGYFGIETTSFAALLGGVGLAVGAAWSGLFSNFAAGAFLVIFRPYKVGDYIIGGGVEGTVTDVGLFNTIITSPDNIQAIVGNAKISGDVVAVIRRMIIVGSNVPRRWPLGSIRSMQSRG